MSIDHRAIFSETRYFCTCSQCEYTFGEDEPVESEGKMLSLLKQFGWKLVDGKVWCDDCCYAAEAEWCDDVEEEVAQ